MTAHVWTLQDFADTINRPIAEIERLAAGGLDMYWAPDPVSGEPGWWWAIGCNGRIYALGWTAGNAHDRDDEIGRTIGIVLRATEAIAAATVQLPPARALS